MTFDATVAREADARAAILQAMRLDASVPMQVLRSAKEANCALTLSALQAALLDLIVGGHVRLSEHHQLTIVQK